MVLQERDLRCENFRKQLEVVPDEIGREKRAISIEQKKLQDARDELRALEVKRAELEGEVEVIEASILRYKTQQMEVKKQEEYSALQHEIDDAGDKVGRLEDEILNLMELVERKQAALAQLEAETKERIHVLEAHIDRLERSRESFAVDLEEALRELEAAKSSVDPGTLTQYEFVKRQVRRGPYAVELDGGKCSGCHLKVSGEVDSTARKGKELVKCNNCGRIVFS